jgi:Isoprenylcysteine carboxyl methyltransferase (ICMT) family
MRYRRAVEKLRPRSSPSLIVGAALRDALAADPWIPPIHHHPPRDTRLVTQSPLRRLLLPAGLLELTGLLEGAEVVRQRRRGTSRSLVTSGSDRDPASVRLLALTWWPVGIAALAAAAWLPRLDVSEKWERPCQAAGVAVTGTGIALRQWAITTLGRFFVGHVLVQPGQTVVNSGPYRWLRHPSYTGLWLEMIGTGAGHRQRCEHGNLRVRAPHRHNGAHQRRGTRAHRKPPRLSRIHPRQTAAHSAHLVTGTPRGAAPEPGRLAGWGQSSSAQ